MAVEISYKGHARQRMRQRGISEQDVEMTLAHPTKVELTPKNSWRYMRTMSNGRTLKVWVPDPDDPNHKVVRSAAWKGEDDE